MGGRGVALVGAPAAFITLWWLLALAPCRLVSAVSTPHLGKPARLGARVSSRSAARKSFVELSTGGDYRFDRTGSTSACLQYSSLLGMPLGLHRSSKVGLDLLLTGSKGDSEVILQSGQDAVAKAFESSSNVSKALTCTAVLTQRNTGKSEAHRLRSRRARNVQWLHLHNQGGTFVCQEAVKQGEKVKASDNCNLEPCSAMSNTKTCNWRASSDSPYTFSMMERSLQAQDVSCDSLLSGTMLRDPIASLETTLVANNFDKAAIVQMLQPGDSSSTDAAHSACLPQWDTYQHADNFAVRSLSGAYLVPPGGMTDEHLQLAKQRLAAMDVVLVLEDLADHLPQLEKILDWDVSRIDTSHKVNSFRDGRPPVLTDEERAFFGGINKLDYELYEYAKQVAVEKTAAAVASATAPAQDAKEALA
eukprot:TRINITY_DN111843_c0_g1_i1.p1 TRINITY_DN111843_c0_g1~~TRINITY_DN111843_c0_g1_i1.p1  ORF type:complete len:419 (+),score=76.14 TRINITY_DN111843_c0_g1_i1:77-1333(+)